MREIIALAVCVLPSLASADRGFVGDVSLGGGVIHILAPCSDSDCVTTDGPPTDVSLALSLGLGAKLADDLVVGGRFSGAVTRYAGDLFPLRMLLGPSVEWRAHERLWIGGGIGVGASTLSRGATGYFHEALGAEARATYTFPVARGDLALTAQLFWISPLEQDGQQFADHVAAGLLAGYHYGR